MRKSVILGLIATAGFAAPLQAQSTGLQFRGFRVEANAGSDRFGSADSHRSKLGYGATIGADAAIGRFVLGVEGSYWRDSKRATNCLTGDAGTFCSSSGQREFGAAVRAGVEITPQLMAFGKLGYVRDRQHEVFTSSGQTFYVDGVFVPGPPSSDLRFSQNGYEFGGGLEYSLQSHIYVSGQYVHSRYRNHTDRDRLMAGLGYRF